MKSSIGSKIRLTVFGESHGAAIGCVLEGLWPQVCFTQSHAYNRRLSGMLKKKKKVHSILYFKKDESFPAFSTYMKCDDSNQVSLSSKL